MVAKCGCTGRMNGLSEYLNDSGVEGKNEVALESMTEWLLPGEEIEFTTLRGLRDTAVDQHNRKFGDWVSICGSDSD